MSAAAERDPARAAPGDGGDGGAARPARERPGAVLGIAVGLALLAGLVLGLARGAFGGFDAERELARLVDRSRGPLPFGLALAGSAELPDGTRLLRLAPPTPPEEGSNAPAGVHVLLPPTAGAAARVLEGAAGGPAGPPGAPGPGDGPARRVRDWERDPSFAFHAALDRRDLEWDEWRAPLARLRSFEAGGTWREALAVDLSREARPLVLVAVWPAGKEASEDALLVLLRALDLGAEEE